MSGTDLSSVVEADPLAEAPAWPGVVGTISIVWGGLSLGCAGCGVVGLLMPILTGSMMQTAFPDGMPPTLQNPPVTMWFSIAFGALISLCLIAAGITLVMRKPVARPLHLVYVVLALISAAVGIWVNMAMQAEIARWIKDNPNTNYAQQAASGAIFQNIGLALGVILGFAWPIFCGVWFGLIKKDASEIHKGAESLV